MEKEDDLFELTKEEYCAKYSITSEEYEMLHKQFQEF